MIKVKFEIPKKSNRYDRQFKCALHGARCDYNFHVSMHAHRHAHIKTNVENLNILQRH